jgi:hypothetical protein
MKILGAVGKIGVFWFCKVNNRILFPHEQIAFNDPTVIPLRMLDDPDSGSFRLYGSHLNFWRQTVINYPELRPYTYTDFPRGRVSYDETTRTFMIFMDPKLNKDQFKTQVVEYFDLSGKQYDFVFTDSHYHISTIEI